MAIDPFYISVGELFERKYVFEVPRYQRGYAWDEAEIEDFLRDIWQCYNARVDGKQKPHFFGSMISVKREKSGSSGRYRTIIDGQQRLATFVILARVVEVALLKLFDEAIGAANDTICEMAKRKATLMRETYRIMNDEVNRKPVQIARLLLSEPDKIYFESLIEHDKPIPPSRFSHELLYEAFQRILQEVIEIYDEQNSLDAKLDCLSIIAEVMQRDADIISIETDDDAEAYRIFQVVNNRGTRLTEGDLMRAATAELLGSKAFQAEFDQAAIRWDAILTAKPSRTEEFLRWYYSSVVGDRPSKSGLFEDFMSRIFPEREQAPISKNQAKEIARKTDLLSMEFTVCDSLLSGQWPFATATVPRWDRNRLQLLIEVLDHTLCIPLLLAAHGLGEKKFSQIIFMVERFAFRTKIISKVHPGSLQKVYHQQALLMRSNPTTYRIDALRKAFREVTDAKAADRYFGSALSEQLVYQRNGSNKYLKYFLTNIEEFLPWFNAGANGDPKVKEKGRVLDLAEFSIEHVYPQNPEKNAMNSLLDPVVNVLGNLTILGPDDNGSVGNKSFSEKVSVFASSPLLINQEFGNHTAWDTESVEKRAKRLCNIAKKLFSF